MSGNNDCKYEEATKHHESHRVEDLNGNIISKKNTVVDRIKIGYLKCSANAPSPSSRNERNMNVSNVSKESSGKKIRPLQKLVLRGLISRAAEAQRRSDLMQAFFALQHSLTREEVVRERSATLIKATFVAHVARQKFCALKKASIWIAKRYHDRKSRREHALEILKNCIVPYMQRRLIRTALCDENLKFSPYCAKELFENFFSSTKFVGESKEKVEEKSEEETKQEEKNITEKRKRKIIIKSLTSLSTLSNDALATVLCGEIVRSVNVKVKEEVTHKASQEMENTIWSLCKNIPRGVPQIGRALISLLLKTDRELSFSSQLKNEMTEEERENACFAVRASCIHTKVRKIQLSSAALNSITNLLCQILKSSPILEVENLSWNVNEKCVSDIITNIGETKDSKEKEIDVGNTETKVENENQNQQEKNEKQDTNTTNVKTMTHKYGIGDSIRCRWKPDGAYYPAKIAGLNEDGTYSISYADGDYADSVADTVSKSENGKKLVRIKLVASSILQPNNEVLNEEELENEILSLNNIPKRSANDDKSVELDELQVRKAIEVGMLISIREQSEIEVNMDVVWCRGQDKDYQKEKGTFAMGSYLATKVSEKNKEMSDTKDACHVPECNYVMVRHVRIENVFKYGQLYRYANATPKYPQIPKRSQSENKSVEVTQSAAELAIHCGLLKLVESQDQVNRGDDVVWKRGTKTTNRNGDSGKKETFLATKILGKHLKGWELYDCVSVPEQAFVVVGQQNKTKTIEFGEIYRYTGKGSLQKLLENSVIPSEKVHVNSIRLSFGSKDTYKEKNTCKGTYEFFGLRQGVISNKFAVPFYVKIQTGIILYQSPSTGKICLAKGTEQMAKDEFIMSTTKPTTFGKLLGANGADIKWIEKPKKRLNFDDSSTDADIDAANKYANIVANIYQRYDQTKGSSFQHALLTKFKGIEEILLSTLFQKFKVPASEIKHIKSCEMNIVCRAVKERDPKQVNIYLTSANTELTLPSNDPLCGKYTLQSSVQKYAGSYRKFKQVKAEETDTSSCNPSSKFRNIIYQSNGNWYIYDESGNRKNNPRWKSTKDRAMEGYLATVPKGIEVSASTRDDIMQKFEMYPPVYGWWDHNNDIKTSSPPFFLSYNSCIVTHKDHELVLQESTTGSWFCDGCTDRLGYQASAGAERWHCQSGCDFDLCQECKLKTEILTKEQNTTTKLEHENEDVMGDEEEAEIEELFRHKKKVVLLLDAKPVLFSLRQSLFALLEIVSLTGTPLSTVTFSSLHYNLRCIATRLMPHNLSGDNNKTNNSQLNVLLSPWRKLLGVIVRAFRSTSKSIQTSKRTLCLLREFYIPAIKSQDADLLRSEDVSRLRRMCVSGAFKHNDVRVESKRLLQKRIPELRSKLLKQTKAWRKQRAEEIAATRSIKRLAYDLQLDDGATEEMGKLLAREEAWVGAHNAKEFVRGYLDDIIGRIRLREDPVIRHILLQGNSGTGKSMAADFIARWMSLVNNRIDAHGDSPSSVKFDGGKPQWIKVGRIVQLINMTGDASGGSLKLGETGKITEVKSSTCKVRGWYYSFTNLGLPERKNRAIEIGSFKELETELGELTKGQKETYYMRLGGGRAGGNVNKILEAAAAKGCAVIFGGSASACQSFASSSMYFLKQDPVVIDMPVLSTTELAKISLQRIEQRGYKLSSSGMSGGNTTQGQLKTMIGIVAQKYSETEIIKRNAYLATDCVELAVSRKNRRLRDFEVAQRLTAEQSKTEKDDDTDPLLTKTSKSAPLPFLLEPVDFDVKTISLEERKRKQKIIDLKILTMKGWGSEEESGTPLHWFATQRRILTKMQSTDETKDNIENNMRPWDFNLIVESGNGGGKATFVEYVSEFLEAYGILESSKLVKRSAAELRAGKWDSDDDAKTKATGAFADAREQNGGLLLVNAESLAPSVMLAASGGIGAAPASSVTASVLANQVGTVPFVALACEEQTSRAVLSAHPDLSSKFPWIVRIEAPTDALLAEIAQEYCEKVRGVTFADGLSESLVEHIRETNDGSTGMRYARTLVDDALRRRAERRSAVKKQQKGETKQENAENMNLRDNPCLIPVDFEIGKELGNVEAREEVYRELEGLIGMIKAKEWLRKIRRQIDLANKTKDRRGLKKCYNLVLTGRPGTGKTTFARLVHRFLKAHGVLTGEFVEKNALELKGEYVGSTTPMVKACFTEAKGGTLFLDEAYALASGSFKSGGDTFSKEAIRTLLTEVENNRTGTVVILAGYEDKMKGLMRADPGLPRRFPHSLHLDNYTSDQLASIAQHVAKRRFDRTFEDGLKEKLAKHISHKYRKDISEQNGGLSVNLVEYAVTNQEDRIMTDFEGLDNECLNHNSRNDEIVNERIQKAKMILQAADFGITDKPEMGTTEQEKEEVEAELASLIGMDNVKRFFHKMRNQALFVQKTGKVEALGGCLHLVLTGNPGTGKTTTARLIARYLKAFGILPTGQFREVNGLHLKGQYVGQTSHRVSSIVKDAIGGCLFIDEAYSLASNGGDAYGKEVIRTLLTEVENHRSDLLVILAGYRGPMAELMNADPGLRSRFNTRLHLKDYSSEEVARIAELTAKRKTFTFENGLISKLSERIETAYGKRRISQENGRMAVNLVERAIERMATRLINSGLDDEEIKKRDSVLTNDDFNDEDEGCFDDFKDDSWSTCSTNFDSLSRPSSSTSTSTIMEISMINSLEKNAPSSRNEFEPMMQLPPNDDGNDQYDDTSRYRDPRIREFGGGDDDDSASRGEKIRKERTAPPKAKVKEEEDVEEQYISVKYNGTEVEISWSPGDDVSNLKERIEEALGLEASQFKIVHDGKTLKDEQTIEELVEDMEEDSELEVIASLFAQMAGMNKVAFAVDLSGSMSNGVGKGQTQMSVVQDHLRRCIRSLNREGCEIGIATFTSRSKLPLGPTMVKCSRRVDEVLQVIDQMRASGGNGGEAECLRSLINMDPQCIFFLGDGGWDGQALIKEANVAADCGIQIHSIAFYLQGVGSGLPEIAKLTGGTYRDVKSISEYSWV
jgi:SpoVK/Ycf46/Vps4 family AAA+-type ATPase